MKKIKFAALVVALAMLCLAMASCGGSPKVSVNCTITVNAGEEEDPILLNYPYTVEGTEENPPTVLQATREALQLMEISYEVDDNGLSFTNISNGGKDYKIGMDAEGANIWAWIYTADGIEPESGRAGENLVLEGQAIEFKYVSTPVNEQVFSDPEA